MLGSVGRSFCSGADLDWMRRIVAYGEEANIADAKALANMLHTLDRLKKPTVGVVQGAAYGGGVGLIACCDTVIASDRATFCLSEVKLGLTPATVGPYVVNAIGPRQARRYFTTAEVFSAKNAMEIGLVHEVVPGCLAEEKDCLIDALLRCAPGAQAAAPRRLFGSSPGLLGRSACVWSSLTLRRAQTTRPRFLTLPENRHTTEVTPPMRPERTGCGS